MTHKKWKPKWRRRRQMVTSSLFEDAISTTKVMKHKMRWVDDQLRVGKDLERSGLFKSEENHNTTSVTTAGCLDNISTIMEI
jgi:hypothetical protein